MKNVVLVADYGRSGQGWLSYMLCYILNAAYVEPYGFAAGIRYTASEHVLSLTQGRLPGRPLTQYSLVVKTHNHPAPNFNVTEKVIYLTRDPRDVAVSKHAMHLANMKGAKNRGPRLVLRTGLRQRAEDALLAIKAVRFVITASRWKAHVLAWRRVPSLHVTYEELKTDPENALRRILAFLEVPIEPDVVTAAVAEFSFGKITGRRAGEEDSLNPEFRKGVSGDYKNHFNRFHSWCVRTVCGDAAALFGYKL